MSLKRKTSALSQFHFVFQSEFQTLLFGKQLQIIFRLTAVSQLHIICKHQFLCKDFSWIILLSRGKTRLRSMLCLRLLQWPSVGARCLHKLKDTTLICDGPFITAKGGFPPLFTSVSQICDLLLMTVSITELKLLAIHGMSVTDFL